MALQYRAEYKVDKFHGLMTEFKDLREIPDGYSPDQLNWLTQTNQEGIELRRGTQLLGLTRNTDVGKVTGLGIGRRFNGVQIPFFSYGRKVNYYDVATNEVVEVGTDLLPEAASGENVSIFPYQNIAGAWVYASSPNSSIYKISSANPGSAKDQLSTEYRGFFKFGQSRGFLFNRHGSTAGNIDQMGLYASAVDKVSLTEYAAQTTGEIVGLAGSQTYTYTLINVDLDKRTGMYITVTATVAAGAETFVDDRNGGLLSNFGGTGTVNYATGEISVTFSDVTTGGVTADYYYEDATDGGVCDFSIANPSDRQPGEGNYFPQFDGGGTLNSMYPLATVFYGFHSLKTWQTQIPVDDESGTDSISTNLPFREKIGVNGQYAAFGGEHGIYFVNTAEQGKPEFMRLELFTGSTAANIARPVTLSQLLDLSPFAYDVSVVHEWNDYVLFCCQQIRNGIADTFNSRMFLYNKISKNFDIVDNPSSRLDTYEGSLLSGDPLTNNVFTLFSGFDDDGALIPNFWTGGDSDLEMDGQKRFTRFVVEGLIQPSQAFEIGFSFDSGNFVKAFTVDGQGSYVNTGKSIAVGSYTVGSNLVGGSAEQFAFPYRVEFRVQSDRFNYVRPRFGALSGGFVSVTSYSYKDIRQKQLRSLPERQG